MTIMKLNVTPLAVKIALVRVARGLKQFEIAKIIDVDPALISRYESGLVPTQDKLKKLEDYFGVDFDDPQIDQAARILAGYPDSITPQPETDPQPCAV